MNKHIDIYALIGANLVSVFMALYFHWDLWNLMILYWCQSVIIGIFTFVKLLSAPVSDYQGSLDKGTTLEINGVQRNDPVLLKLVMSVFFLVHYGSFHFGYLLYILTSKFSEISRSNPGMFSRATDFNGIIFSFISGSIPVIFFLINHWYSYYVSTKRDLPVPISVTSTFWKPYLRILPMNAVIISGGFMIGFSNSSNISAIVLFMLIKTAVDVLLHILEHKPTITTPPITT